MRLVRLAQLLLLPGLISYILGATITVEGTGYSKEGAIQSALRGAVEQAAGLSIHSETIVQNFSVLSDKIISNAVGYVSSYRVAAVTQQYGLVKVKVQAEVALGKLEADLSAKGLLYKQIGKPRVMIVIDERSGGKQLLEKTAAHSIEDYLQKNGFTLVDQKQLLVSTAGKTDSAAGTYAFFQGADLLVTGHVSVSEPLAVMVYGVQFYSVSVQVNAKVIRSDNGQVIASAVKTVSKKSRDPHSATNIGLSTGGESIAMELLDDLNTFWQSAVYNENTIEVVVKGGREPQLAALEEGFLHLPVIRSFQMRYLLGSLAVYDFDLRGSVHDFRAAIKKNESMQSVVIDSMYSGRIVLRLDVADFKDDRIDPEHIDLLIATLRIDPVFPSRIRSYENQPLVHFSLPKNSPNKYKVKITIPDIMETFSETTVEQKNTENGLCSVQLLLNDTRVLGNTSNRKVYAEIELCDVSNRKMICHPIASPVTIYEKNAMDWKVPGTIATFVTFRDQAVIDIASKSIKGLSDSHLKGITKNLLKGSAVFTAVKESGISYVKDPIALPGTVMLDRVQFPLETVKRAAGDCDDLSVLYASLLSSVGIPCAMVIFPGHVFVMFDTGIFEKNRYRLSLDTSLTITHNGTLWVPVETTAPGSGFKNAWFNAAQEFSNALSAGEHIQIIDLADAWETWPPPQFPGTFHTPELKNLNSAVISEIKVLQKATDSINGASIKYAMASMEKNDSSQIALDYNKIGVFEVRQGDYSKAQTWFEKSLALHKNHSVAANLAGALFLQGNELNSLQLFDSLVRYDTDGTVALNQALCLYAQKLQPGQVDQVIKSFKNAVSKMSDTHLLERYLGFSLTRSEGRKGNYQSLPENNTVNVSQLSALIRSSILDGERLNVSGTTSETSSGTKFSGTTSETSSGSLAVDKKQIVMPSGRVKGADPEMCVGLKELLYWFE